MPQGAGEPRRLAAVMFTDMVGFTALTQSSEAQALELLERHNRLLRPILAKHEGREVKTIGDSFLVEFASCLDAINCAIEIQLFLRDYNLSSREGWRIWLRIGIHLGDVVRRDGDIFGDAVNVASRIQPLADPEGICISEQVFYQVRNKAGCSFERLEHADLKNVRLPTSLYKVVMPSGAGQKKGAMEPEFDRKRLAVLPFANISPDPKDEYFADGMTEELISTMSKIDGLKVIARTSVMGYKGGQKKINEIARELEVGVILEGSVRKAGDKLRITVQLIDSQSSDHLWSESYDRELQDIFAIQSDISQTVADSLKIKLFQEERERLEKKDTENAAALTLYLKGRYHWNERNEKSLRQAITCFEQAIRADSSYAPAYAGLADSYSVMAIYCYAPPKGAYENARKFAAKALELDEGLAEAHVTLAWVLVNDWNWEAAGREFRRAIEINPNYATAHHWYALCLEANGRIEEALSEIRRALELDPFSPVINCELADILGCAKRYGEAIVQLQDALGIDENFGMTHSYLGLMYLKKSLFSEALAELEKAASLLGRSADSIADLAYAYALTGNKREAKKLLSELQGRSEYVFPHTLAVIYSGLGDKDRAFELLEEAYKEHSAGLIYLNTFRPVFDELRSDPRFQALLKKFGLVS